MDTPEGYVALRLVPVEVFGTDRCCLHGLHANCEATGHGLCDAVQAWSDCNRAEGHIYRVDDEWAVRLDGETVEVLVKESDAAWFEKRWGDSGPDGA